MSDEPLDGCTRLALAPTAFGAIETVYDEEGEIDPMVEGLSDKELACLNVGRFSSSIGLLSVVGSASFSVAGAAGETLPLEHVAAKGLLDDAVPDADGRRGDSVAANSGTQRLRLKVGDFPDDVRHAPGVKP